MPRELRTVDALLLLVHAQAQRTHARGGEQLPRIELATRPRVEAVGHTVRLAVGAAALGIEMNREQTRIVARHLECLTGQARQVEAVSRQSRLRLHGRQRLEPIDEQAVVDVGGQLRPVMGDERHLDGLLRKSLFRIRLGDDRERRHVQFSRLGTAREQRGQQGEQRETHGEALHQESLDMTTTSTSCRMAPPKSSPCTTSWTHARCYCRLHSWAELTMPPSLARTASRPPYPLDLEDPPCLVPRPRCLPWDCCPSP